MCTELSGPDFLDKLADTESGNGFDINAHEYRKRASEWRELEKQANAQEIEVARLTSELRILRAQATRAAAELTAA